MATQSDLVADINAVKDQVTKIGIETSATLDKVAELEAALANAGGVGGVVTPELQAAVEALKAQVTLVDDLIPDATA